MTAKVQPESKSSSRRAVLAAALGGAAAMVARTVIQPGSARAAGEDGQPILVGSTFLDVRTGTYLSDAATDATVFSAVSSSAGGHGAGIGVLGASSSGNGVRGTSDNGSGVRGTSGFVGIEGEGGTWGVVGFSPAGIGVRGVSTATDQPGSLGFSNGNSTGVQGFSGGLVIPPAKAKTGVYGHAAQDSTSKGVWGQTTSGIGLYGKATTGLALQTSGRAKFSTSGVATITAGHTTKVITPGVNVTSGSFVLLTAKTKLGGRDLWFTTNATGNKFTIHMSSSRSSGTKVAWLLLG